MNFNQEEDVQIIDLNDAEVDPTQQIIVEEGVDDEL